MKSKTNIQIEREREREIGKIYYKLSFFFNCAFSIFLIDMEKSSFFFFFGFWLKIDVEICTILFCWFAISMISFFLFLVHNN